MTKSRFIIYSYVLCTEFINFRHVLFVAVSVVNFVHSWSLIQRLLQEIRKEINSR